jgi:4-hydroxybenzoate polyprenyltransferase
MALVVARVLDREGDEETGSWGERLISHVSYRLPAYLYLLSTLMFTIVNLAHGYTVAGLVGVLVLLVIFTRQRSILTRRRRDAEVGRWGEVEV